MSMYVNPGGWLRCPLRSHQPKRLPRWLFLRCWLGMISKSPTHFQHLQLCCLRMDLHSKFRWRRWWCRMCHARQTKRCRQKSVHRRLHSLSRPSDWLRWRGFGHSGCLEIQEAGAVWPPPHETISRDVTVTIARMLTVERFK